MNQGASTRSVTRAIGILVNGEPRSIAAGSTVAELLAAHDLDPALVVVERNGGILSRAAFERTPLEPGDALEIVHFVGGG
jgi:thiamine biosynthesis protein ThiS